MSDVKFKVEKLPNDEWAFILTSDGELVFQLESAKEDILDMLRSLADSVENGENSEETFNCEDEWVN